MRSSLNIARSLAAVAAALITGIAAPATAGPDFVTDDRARPLAASDVRGVTEPTDELLFALDDAALDSIAVLQLAAVVRWLDGRPDDRVVVEGRTDSSGPSEHNTALAIRRAEAVRNHLMGRGVDPDRIVLAVYGENGARQRPEAHDRRAVIYTTKAPIGELVATELDNQALEVVWTHLGTRLRETRGITPLAVR
jgi:outer membrane protein OmpA-like peptidoglycan-associated protein